MWREIRFWTHKFPVKIKDIHKTEKNVISISVFDYKNKGKHLTYVLKNCFKEKNVELCLIRAEDKRHYLLSNNFNTFMYYHTLHRGRKLVVVIVYKLLLQKNFFKMSR